MFRLNRRAFLLAILFVLGTAAAMSPWLWAWHQFRQGQAELEQSHPEEARRHFNSCLRFWPHYVPAHLLAARAARRLEDYEEAEEHLRQAQDQQRQPSDEVVLEWALHRATLGDLKRMESYLLPLTQDDSEEAFLACEALAQGYQRNYRIPQALALLDRWLKRRPNEVRPLLLRGRLWMQVTSWKRAATDYLRVLELEPKREEAQRGLALCLTESMRWDEAMPYWKELQQQHPADLEVRTNLARCLANLGQEQHAQEMLRAVLQERPDNPAAQRSLGEILLQDQQPAEAETWLRRAVQAAPNDYRASWFLYRALQLQNKTAEAERQLDQANQLQRRWERLSRITQHELAARPHDIALYTELGVLLLDLGNEQAGRNWLLLALQKDPNFAPARTALEGHQH